LLYGSQPVHFQAMDKFSDILFDLGQQVVQIERRFISEVLEKTGGKAAETSDFLEIIFDRFATKICSWLSKNRHYNSVV